jgi:N-acetylglutamate synthase
MKNIQISQPTREDINVLWKWGEENWELWGDEKNKWFSKTSLERWIREPEDDILLVVRDGEKCIGMCIINVIRDWAFCFGLYVEKEYRGQGIGKQLLDTAELSLKKQHITSCLLLVDVKNSDAIRFYEREGFYTGFQFYLMTNDRIENV